MIIPFIPVGHQVLHLPRVLIRVPVQVQLHRLRQVTFLAPQQIGTEQQRTVLIRVPIQVKLHRFRPVMFAAPQQVGTEQQGNSDVLFI